MGDNEPKNLGSTQEPNTNDDAALQEHLLPIDADNFELQIELQIEEETEQIKDEIRQATIEALASRQLDDKQIEIDKTNGEVLEIPFSKLIPHLIFLKRETTSRDEILQQQDKENPSLSDKEIQLQSLQDLNPDFSPGEFDNILFTVINRKNIIPKVIRDQITLDDYNALPEDERKETMEQVNFSKNNTSSIDIETWIILKALLQSLKD